MEMGERKQMLMRIDSSLQGLTGTINGLMNGMSQQQSQDSAGMGWGSSSNRRRTNLQFGTYGSSGSHYSIPTKNTKVEFPKFDGTDFKGWSYRCRQFFNVDGTPFEQRIRFIGIHLEDKALRLHLAFMKNCKEEEVSWEEYMKQMEARFSDLQLTDHMVKIKRLQQGNSSVDEYIKEFDSLLTEVEIPEKVSMSCFLGGLCTEIQTSLEAFQPDSLSRLMQMAHIQKRSINCVIIFLRLSNRSFAFSKPVVAKSVLNSGFKNSYANFSKANTSVTKAVPSVESTGSSVTLSKKEMEDRRKKGLCYWCNDRYTSSHKCRQSKVMMLVVQGHEEDDFMDAKDSLEVVESKMKLKGSIRPGREGFSTLRLEGYIEKQKLIFLADSGSSHNVVHSHVTKKLNLNSELQREICVGVAGGSIVKVDRVCKALEWSMSGHKFIHDFLIMDIGVFDVILGAQWLRKLGRLILDMTSII